MRLSFRISYTMLIISICTLTLLTVLMHFKYHTTRLTLINERLNVVSTGISQPLNNALLLGIDVKDIKSLEDIIKKAKDFDKTISNIVIFKIEKDLITPVFSTEKKELSASEKATLLQSLRISKNKYWKGSLGEQIRFAGVTLKDVANQERVGISIFYDLTENSALEAVEIGKLYRRLIMGMFFAALINFATGFQNTRELSKIMKFTENAIVTITNKPEQKIDLGKISDPGIRSQLRLMINSIATVSRYTTKAENIIRQCKLNPED